MKWLKSLQPLHVVAVFGAIAWSVCLAVALKGCEAGLEAHRAVSECRQEVVSRVVEEFAVLSTADSSTAVELIDEDYDVLAQALASTDWLPYDSIYIEAYKLRLKGKDDKVVEYSVGEDFTLYKGSEYAYSEDIAELLERTVGQFNWR